MSVNQDCWALQRPCVIGKPVGFGKNVDQETESRFHWRYEITNDCIDIGLLLFRSGIVFRWRLNDGHMEA